jgi:hypothetical protein
VVPAERAVINDWGHPQLRSNVTTPETVIMRVALSWWAPGGRRRVAVGARPDRPLLELIPFFPGRVDSPVNGLVVRRCPA